MIAENTFLCVRILRDQTAPVTGQLDHWTMLFLPALEDSKVMFRDYSAEKGTEKP